jgi:ribose 1,5-bisphosphokinase PhnN
MGLGWEDSLGQARLILLMGPSGVGKSSLKAYLQSTYGMDSAPKFTTRPSRLTPEDERDFIFCDLVSFPSKGILRFDSYGAVFGIQTAEIARSLQKGTNHVLVVGDCTTVGQLSELYPGLVVTVLVYCDRDVLYSRVAGKDLARIERWPRIAEEIDNFHSELRCVRFVVNNSGTLTEAFSQLDWIISLLSGETGRESKQVLHGMMTIPSRSRGSGPDHCSYPQD